MTSFAIVILLVLGFLGGIANSVAGGASLFTFPALLATGLPPIIANASNAFALLPANWLGVYGDHEKLPSHSRWFFVACAAALAGGTAGAVLLLITPAKTFGEVVPALIGLATLIFAFAKPIRRFVSKLIHGDDHPKLRAGLIAAFSIYGGYFGAGLGVMLMAVLESTTPWDLRRCNAFKNLLGFLTNLAAIVIFLRQGIISWPETLVMMTGTAAGGFTGAKLVKILPASVVRFVIILAGSAMTAFSIYRYWA